MDETDPFVVDAGFYNKGLNMSSEVLMRSNNKLLTKSDKRSFDALHSEMRSKH